MIDVSTVELMMMHYAAGTLGPAEALMMAAHAAVNPEARRKIAALEAAGARMVCEETTVTEISSSCRDAVFRRIETCTREMPLTRPQAQATTPAATPETVPEMIARLLGKTCSPCKMKWREAAPGIEKIDLMICHTRGRSDRKVRLLRLAPGRYLPRHCAGRPDILLVLDGALTDGARVFMRGDMIFSQGTYSQPDAAAGPEGATCLTLTEAPKMQVFGFFTMIFRR